MVTGNNNRKALSKFLSYVLRHHPEAIGLEVDSKGWADMDELIEKARDSGRTLDRDLLMDIVNQGTKQRFILSGDAQYIRAGYGHSIDVDLDLKAQEPPEKLYHGTAKKYLESICSQGLRPGSRNFVHLSATADEARNVGARHGKPVVLTIRAKKMNDAGYECYQSESEPGIWLSKEVPVEFIDI